MQITGARRIAPSVYCLPCNQDGSISVKKPGVAKVAWGDRGNGDPWTRWAHWLDNLAQ